MKINLMDSNLGNKFPGKLNFHFAGPFIGEFLDFETSGTCVTYEQPKVTAVTFPASQIKTIRATSSRGKNENFHRNLEMS